MHLTGFLPPGIDDRAVSGRAAALGVEASPLSAYALGPLPAAGSCSGMRGARPADIRAPSASSRAHRP